MSTRTVRSWARSSVARYAAEAALVATVSYIEEIGDLTAAWRGWAGDLPPAVGQYTAGHAIPNTAAGRHSAARVTDDVLAASSNGVPPVSRRLQRFRPSAATVERALVP